MANAITLAQSYVPMLDEVYKLASITAKLDGAPNWPDRAPTPTR